MEIMTKKKSEMSIPKDDLVKQALDDYLCCDVPDFRKARKTSYFRKILNERRIQRLLDKLMDEIAPYRVGRPEELSTEETKKLKKIIVSFLLEVDKKKCFFDRPFLKFFIDKGYLDVAEDFVFRARNEDSKLEPVELFQAMRNVWIMNSLQIIWGKTLEMTPSIYAYSMLYPYTDNYLDDPAIGTPAKDNFNRKLSRVLMGEKQVAATFHEKRVFELIKDIESQYNRHLYPQVYESILLIHAAQIESLNQDRHRRMAVNEILPISFFKGGSSVLADAFLVKGNLSSEEMQFSFEYGTFLQLLDDLQDAIQDREEGHQTIFSIQDTCEIFDEHVTRLIAYIFKVNASKQGESETMILMKEVIRSCTLVMVMDAVGRNQTLVSKDLYKKLESLSKVRLSFYKKMELKLNELLDIRNEGSRTSW